MSAHPYDLDPGLPRKARFGRVPVELNYPTWTHPSVMDCVEDWQTIRDCAAGERTIKEAEETYLKPLDEMTRGEYAAYLDRAVFFNMTGRTISALTGIVFQRTPQVSNLPKKLEKKFRMPTRNGITFDSFLKKICRELVTLGRYGVLIDFDQNSSSDPNAAPYFVGYTAEHILDWQESVIDGRLVPTEIALRELHETRGPFGSGKTVRAVYRRLALEWSNDRQDFQYCQYIYEGDGLNVDLVSLVPTKIIPTRNGVPFNRIPFAFLGAIDNTPEVDRSPIVDIATLNVAHYRSYAQLEHSRFYTAMPVFYAQIPMGQSKRTYRVGSSVVWEVAPGEKPGILEMNGHGLNGLVTACEQKEDQISALGGRLMSNQTRSVAESDNALKLKEGNERSILLNIVFSVTEGMSDMLRKWAWWAGADNVDDIEVVLNKEFLTDTLGARELRAVYQMYTDGAVPVTVLHHYLQKAEVIPDWMDVDMFKRLLDDESEFKNNPDAIAKMKGYATAKDRVTANLSKRELRNEEELAKQTRLKVEEEARLKAEQMSEDAIEAEKVRKHEAEQAELDRKAAEKEAEKARKSAERTAAATAKVAAAAAKAKPVPAKTPGGGGAR